MGASLCQLIPVSELAPGQAGAIRNEIVRRMIAEAMAKTNLSEDKIVVRDIRAKDDVILYSGGSAVDLEDWGCVTGTTANAYETMAADTMADQRWIGIYGVKVDEDALSCTALKFNIGGADRVIWQLQALNEDDGFVGFCPSGVIIPQNDPYTISRWVRIASTSTHIVLKGVVVEPRGKLISP